MKIGVFICHCGSNIAEIVDTAHLARTVLEFPDVAFATGTMCACSKPGREGIFQAIKEQVLDNVVFSNSRLQGRTPQPCVWPVPAKDPRMSPRPCPGQRGQGPGKGH